MAKWIKVIPENCVGCESCMLACSFTHENYFNRSLSRIKVINFWKEGRSTPIVCSHCEDPKCMAACSVNAITQTEEGVILLDHTKCIGCKQCVMACPFGAIFLSKGQDYPLKCDLCNGDPQCVRICEVGALQLVDDKTPMEPKRVLAAKQIKTAGIRSVNRKGDRP